MTMSDETNQAIIESRLREAFSPNYLVVINESEQHIGHAGYVDGGRHFAIEISASQLSALSRVAAHRKIYALFEDLMPHQLHALRIVIR